MQQRLGAGRLGLGHLDREVARGRIVGDGLGDLVGHVELRHDAVDALLHRGAEGVVDVHEHHRLRRRAGGLEDLLLVGEGVAEDHRRGREVAEHELVALLGDRRGGGDVDDEGDALLLGHLGDRRGLAGVEGADQQLRALADQPLGARARDLDVGFGVAVHDGEVRQAQVLEDAGGDLDAALAVLADAGLHARARQQHADLQGRALRAADAERRGAGEQRRRRRRRRQTCAASRAACGTCELRCDLAGHCSPPIERALTACALLARHARRSGERRRAAPRSSLTLRCRLAIIVA